ncbi:protein-tyrosine-phosphatase [Polymorphobacter multimanifer]|uniref:Protein-tyrosine phosphatase n=1 Tax=Polymorphobacter multimanifer TaxID=1070431 RepID=A0A841LBW9_9SPHN|nr:tyrosine-protein phosphatase [Polymorphobacter multimanifer]MBB6228473.1 protein-tyrosine phosphatase [Polymorphobacter multimanifer]GGI80525.1 protein-tyrosine-phosphatase [Polymorphobacter multimanifer]
MRNLLLLLLVSMPLVQPVAAVAREAVTPLAVLGEAVREGDKVRLRWSGLRAPVQISRLTTADARRGTVVAAAVGSDALVDAPANPRPYFLLRGADGRELRLAERVLPLEGGMNFRDLGGYVTIDGRPVKWGKIYRSAVMSGLTAGDYRYLSGLGIGAVCDFRANEERMREPVNWPASMNMKVLTREYKLEMAPLMAMFGGGDISAENTRAAMASFYTEMPVQFGGQFKEMFAELVEGRAPLAFNCSAGKDRTGLAAVLVLLSLGVPRETAIEDYLLSNQHYRPKPPAPGGKPDPMMAMFARLPTDVSQALIGVERRYIEASLAAIDARGGLDRYLREDMGLGPAELARLRQLYLAR